MCSIFFFLFRTGCSFWLWHVCDSCWDRWNEKQIKINKQKIMVFQVVLKEISQTISATYKFTKSEKNLRRLSDQSDRSAMIVYGTQSSVLMKHVSDWFWPGFKLTINYRSSKGINQERLSAASTIKYSQCSHLPPSFSRWVDIMSYSKICNSCGIVILFSFEENWYMDYDKYDCCSNTKIIKVIGNTLEKSLNFYFLKNGSLNLKFKIQYRFTNRNSRHQGWGSKIMTTKVGNLP